MADKLITPDLPGWNKFEVTEQQRSTLLPADSVAPIIMGDAYSKTPKGVLAQQTSTGLQKSGDSSFSTYAYASSGIAQNPESWLKTAQMAGVSNLMTNPMWFSPIHTPQSWQIAHKRREVYMWCRFFYDNEPKVAAAIDFYSQFPMNGFKLECKSQDVLDYFDRKVVKKLKINELMKGISREYFMLGDVIVHLDIQCPQCHGSGIDPDTSEVCNHPDGTFSRATVLNPDWIEIQKTPLTDEPAIVMVPDEDLKRIVRYRQPKAIYDRIPDAIKNLVVSQTPIPLSNRTVSHLKHQGVPYGIYGTSLIRRLFTTLAYKTKIMTANWIVAERLIIPVRVIKIGSDARPATSADIADIQQQVATTANDPNLTIVTHHNFEYDFYGACHDANTEILTPHGWKGFSDINEGDDVATYNLKKDEIGNFEFQAVQEKHEYDFDSSQHGKMIHILGRSVDIMVTPNHTMLVERNGKVISVMSQNLKHNDKFISTMNWEGGIPEKLPYADSPIGHMDIDDYLRIAGYYISEGGVKRELTKNLSKECVIQACSISQNIDSPCYEDMRDMVKKTYANYSLSINDDRSIPTHYFTINSAKIARYFVQEFGINSESKRIPQWVMNLPCEKLSIILDALVAGDGDCRYSKNGIRRYRYSTVSKQLADQVSEICLKLGNFSNTSIEVPNDETRKDIYRVYWSERRRNTKYTIRNRNIFREDYIGKTYCVTVPNGYIVTRRNGKITVQGNSGKILQVTQELEYVGKEILDGFMLNQALLNGEMSGYQSAQVGVETLIRRIESWRQTLGEWVEERIFKPISEMQGFIDKEESERFKEPVFIYPKIKWNELNLKDNTQWYQTLFQLHDKQLISNQTLTEEMGMDYDQEVKRMRFESTMVGPAGMMGGMGGAGGAGGMGGGMGGGGGAPGGDMGGGDMGMGGGGMMPMDGGETAPGGIPGMGPGPMAGASGKIMKKGKGKEAQEEENQMNQYGYMKFTKIEQKMAEMLMNLNEAFGYKFQIYPQFPVQNPKGGKPYALDFAFPKLKIGVECDGELHAIAEQKEHDKERDYLLARRGWTILRFDEKAIEEAPAAVKQTISSYIKQASQGAGKKVASKKDPEKNILLYTVKHGELVDMERQYDNYLHVVYTKSYDQKHDMNKWGYVFDHRSYNKQMRTGMMHKQ